MRLALESAANTWQNVNEIAAFAGCDEPRVAVVLKQMVAAGEVAKKKWRGVTVYRLSR